jgi:hypothetical protein
VLPDLEGRTVGVGPVLSFTARLGKNGRAAELKWLPELDVQNRLKGDYVWFKLGMAFNRRQVTNEGVAVSTHVQDYSERSSPGKPSRWSI